MVSQCLPKPCTTLLLFLVKRPYMVKVEAIFQLFCCIAMLCFYHPLFSSTPLLVPRHFPKSVFLCGFFSKLFAYFHLSSCNFDQLYRFCMLPQSCKQLHTTYSNAELSSCFDGQLKAQPVQSVVRIKISLSSSSFKTDPECSLPSSQGSWKQECPGCGPESDLGLEHIMF